MPALAKKLKCKSENVISQMSKIEGPKYHQVTIPEEVRYHDDISTYTGARLDTIYCSLSYVYLHMWCVGVHHERAVPKYDVGNMDMAQILDRGIHSNTHSRNNSPKR